MQKTIDICITGLLARSFRQCLPSINDKLVKPLIEKKFIVNFNLIIIDPLNNLVDCTLVNTDEAIDLAKSLWNINNIIRITQDELDNRARIRNFRKNLDFLECHKNRNCSHIHIPNMYRHLQLEQLCSNVLKKSLSNYAISLSPDIHINNINIDNFIHNLKSLNCSQLLVPSGSLGTFIINGFVAGQTKNVIMFLARQNIIPKAESEKIMIFKKKLVWEQVCAATCKVNKLTIFPFKIDIHKIRANGKIKSVFALIK